MAKAAATRKRQPRRRQKGPALSTRLSRALPWTLAAVLLVAALVGLIYLPSALNAWPIREVRVEGVKDQKRQQQVKLALTELVSGENFFSVPLDKVYHQVRSLSWVADAQASRQWPDRVVLKVEERVPVAVWNGDELVSSAGKLFQGMGQYDVDKLPHLSGPPKRLEEVMDYYHSMSKVLKQVSLGIQSMKVDARLTARLKLGNGILLVVDREHYARKLRRFVQLYDGVLSTDSRGIARVDLRYGDGVAVKWRDNGKRA